MLPPSGRQVVLAHGNQRAVVVEVGGGLREYTVAGLHVIDGYAEHELSASSHGMPLIPWPNRVENGSYRFGDQDHQLALTEPATGNAIHGLLRFVNWEVRESTPASAVMGYRLHPQPGYPFMLDVRLRYMLANDGLTVRMSAVNIGTTACPFGAGAHPYVTLGSEQVDDLLLQLPAQSWLSADDRGIPRSTEGVTGTRYDFRTPQLIGDTKLDTGFADLDRDADARARISLQREATGARLEVWLDEGYPYVMLFTGDTVVAGRRRQGLAVEPMTCAPNALRSGEGLIALLPGESATATWGITVTTS